MFKGNGSTRIRRAAIAAAAAATLAAGAAVVATTSADAAVKPAAPATVSRCTVTELAVWLNLSEANGAAGSIGYPLEFTNIGHSTCYLDGYPGVSALGATGKQLGNAAAKNPLFKATKVVLSPGHTAHADLIWTIVQNFPASKCKPAKSSLIRVYAPNDKKANLAFASVDGCSVKGETYLFTSTVQPGPNGE